MMKIQTIAASLCLLFALVQRAGAGAVCNLCGCDGCRIGKAQAIIEMPLPNNPKKKTKQNCQALFEIASSPDNAFSKQECNDLYKIATRDSVCGCFYRNGTDVPPLNGKDATGDDDDDDDPKTPPGIEGDDDDDGGSPGVRAVLAANCVGLASAAALLSLLLM